MYYIDITQSLYNSGYPYKKAKLPSALCQKKKITFPLKNFNSFGLKKNKDFKLNFRLWNFFKVDIEIFSFLSWLIIPFTTTTTQILHYIYSTELFQYF